MSQIIDISMTDLHPNDYNPNQMTDTEFAELVAEVKHLGRLPKPIIVRPNDNGNYVIIDGEHGWRAAKESKLSKVPCEVTEVDDFEAMRQTYKRNQHGSHNPVLLGQMFEKMKKDQKLSNRELAKKIEVSEGTIRNALLYSEAAKVRNDYAFENLSVKQLRYANMLPEKARNLWLDSGADILALFNAVAPKGTRKLTSKKKVDITRWLWEDAGIWKEENEYLNRYNRLFDDGLYDTYLSEWQLGDADRFVMVFQKALAWWNFELEYFPTAGHDELRQQWRQFIKSFFDVGWQSKDTAFKYMNGILAMIFDPANKSFLITPQDFEQICKDREYKNTGDLQDIVRIAVYEKHGKLLEEDSKYNTETFTEKLQKIEIQEKAPDYIKKSQLITKLKYGLWKASGPEWAKKELAKKSYIPPNAQRAVDEIVELKNVEKKIGQEKDRYKKTKEYELVANITKLIHPDNGTARKQLYPKIEKLKKPELWVIAEALEVYIGLIKEYGNRLDGLLEQAGSRNPE